MQTAGGALGIQVFNNDHSLGTWTIKKAYWQPRGMPLFSNSDGEHVMNPVKESWENFNINNFNETVCASGACNCGDFKPENVIDTVDINEKDKKSDDLKESWADYGKSPEDTILANFISNLDLDSICDDNCGPDVYQESTSWKNYKSLKEGDQVQPQQQVTSQQTQQVQQAPVQQQVAQQPVQQNTQQQVQPQVQQINTTPAQVQPQSQIANPNVATTQQTQAQQVQQPNQQTVQQPQQNTSTLPESTSWANFNPKIIESIALPGGQLYGVEPTDYEKELDKHNKIRKSTKVVEPENVGDKDAGENGIHNFNDNGTPTAKLNKDIPDSKVNDLLKPTHFTANEKAKSNDEGNFKNKISDAEKFNKAIDSLFGKSKFTKHWYD